MKKLYSRGTVHPSPSPISDHFSLSYLPATILTLAAALSSSDKELLSYLLSASDFDPSKPHHNYRNNKSPNDHHLHHLPCFSCHCFSCYTAYWARWDSSPNRQLIHEIIDAFEEGLLLNRNEKKKMKKKKQGLTRRDKRKNNNNNTSSKDLDLDLDLSLILVDNGNKNGCDGSGRVIPELGQPESDRDSGGVLGNGGGGDVEIGEEKQGSVRKIVSFIGERIWGTVWG